MLAEPTAVPPRPRSSAPQVVALRALKLGDLLVAVPALRAMRHHWPSHHLVLATSGWLRDLVDLVGGVDRLLPQDGLRHGIDASARGAEVVVNLHGAGPRSNELLDELHPARRIGHRGHGWNGPPWVDDLHERHRWIRLLEHHGVPGDPDDLYLDPPEVPSRNPGAVVVHHGAAYGSRRWPPARFARVARWLSERGEHVVVTGSGAERGRALAIAAMAGLPAGAVAAGRTDLPELAALVAGARLVVTGDTGIAHLGYAYRTPSVVLFGPVPPRYWGPPEHGPHVALGGDAARRGDPFAPDPDPALLAVDVADVIAAARELLGAENRGTCSTSRYAANTCPGGGGGTETATAGS